MSNASIQPVSSDKPLQLSERLLQGIAVAANALLTVNDYRDAVNVALAAVGNALQVDRVYIFEHHNHPDSQEPAISQRWEWVAEGVVPELDNPVLQNLPYSEFAPRWHRELNAGHPIVGLIKDFPPMEQELLAPQGILSILVVPIQIGDYVWGFVGFDQCQQEHQWTETEINALWALAGSFGGTIARQRIEQDLLETNYVLRESQALLKCKTLDLEAALEQLQRTQMQMVQSEKMVALGNLVSGVAHEVNNPISFLNGSIQNAKDYFQDLFLYLETYQQAQPPPEPVIELAKEIDLEYLLKDFPKLLDSMQGATDRITGISNSLRTFSRADTEYKVKANLHDGLDSTLLILKYKIKATDQRSAIEVIRRYGDVPEFNCYPGQLNQVFMNILSNAIDILDERDHRNTCGDRQSTPPKITIQTTMLPDQQSVEIRIRDNGQGMSPEIQAKVFDHLFTTKEVGKGTGLGLAIAHQIIVDKHDGTIEVNSVLGQGTEFILKIPVATT